MVDDALMGVIQVSGTPSLLGRYVADVLRKLDFGELSWRSPWGALSDWGRYYLMEDGLLVAIWLGRGDLPKGGFRIGVAHTDTPCLRLLPKADCKVDGYHCLRLTPYGGPLLGSWLGHPLSVMGRVFCRDEDGEVEVAEVEEFSVGVISHLPPHFNKKVNDSKEGGVRVDPAKHLLLQLGATEEKEENLSFVGRVLDIDPQRILSHDLRAISAASPTLIGERYERLLAPRLDNALGCHALLEGFISRKETSSASCRVMVLCDHEEVGSGSSTGALSGRVRDVLRRILLWWGCQEREAFFRTLENSSLLSVDGDHAMSPGHGEVFAEGGNTPILGKGPSLKIPSGLAYSTDALSGAKVMALAQRRKILLQHRQDRPGVRGGSSMGPLVARGLGIPSGRAADVGVALLNMHWSTEVASIKDIRDLGRLCEAFYEEGL